MPEGLESSSGFQPCPSTRVLPRGASASGMNYAGFKESPSSFRHLGWYRNGELFALLELDGPCQQGDGCEQLQRGFGQAPREHTHVRTHEVPGVHTGRTRRSLLQPLFGPSKCA